ncbi:MAG: glutaredoxin domain-containing protein [Ancrocorticia sp.]
MSEKAPDGTTATIDFYSALWCRDCRRSKKLLDNLGVAYTYHDLETEEGAPQRAQEISGQMRIPVVHFSDGTFQVEPSDAELREKIIALGLYAE